MVGGGGWVAVPMSTPLERVDTFSAQPWPALYDSTSCFVHAGLSGFLKSQDWDARSVFTLLVPWKRTEGVTGPSPYSHCPLEF